MYNGLWFVVRTNDEISITDIFIIFLVSGIEWVLAKDCIGRELNPGLPRGRREFYH